MKTSLCKICFLRAESSYYISSIRLEWRLFVSVVDERGTTSKSIPRTTAEFLSTIVGAASRRSGSAEIACRKRQRTRSHLIYGWSSRNAFGINRHKKPPPSRTTNSCPSGRSTRQAVARCRGVGVFSTVGPATARPRSQAARSRTRSSSRSY